MSKDTVDIACKMPHGLRIEVGVIIPKDDKGNSIGANVIHGPKYESITLNGWNSNLVIAGQPAELNPAPGITRNVPKDVWEEWMATSGKNHPAVKNGLIFVVPSKAQLDDVRVAAESLRSGLEPLDPNKMPEEMEEAPVDGRPRLTKPKARAA